MSDWNNDETTNDVTVENVITNVDRVLSDSVAAITTTGWEISGYHDIQIVLSNRQPVSISFNAERASRRKTKYNENVGHQPKITSIG